MSIQVFKLSYKFSFDALCFPGIGESLVVNFLFLVFHALTINMNRYCIS